MSQAEQTVQAEAERRLASVGSDRTRWPAMARDEVLRLEKKQQVGQPLSTLLFVVACVSRCRCKTYFAVMLNSLPNQAGVSSLSASPSFFL